MGVKNVRLPLLFGGQDGPIVAIRHAARRLPHFVGLDVPGNACRKRVRVASVFESVESWSALTRG